MSAIDLQPEPVHIAVARRALDDVLAEPALEPSAHLAVGAALVILGDVLPPYPPLPQSWGPRPLEQGLATAIKELEAALSERPEAEVMVRIARALRELRPLWPLNHAGKADARSTP